MKSLLFDRAKAIVPADDTGRLPLPRWPPDLFAVCAILLQESGAYDQVVRFASPPLLEANWPETCQSLAKRWIELWDDKEDPTPPDALIEWWNVLVQSEATLEKLHAGEAAAECRAIVKLFCVADQACGGVGIETDGTQLNGRKRILKQAIALLIQHGTLTRSLRDPLVVVLPKQHTPQRGMTLRSLSHHLALIPSRGMKCRWEYPIRVTEDALRRLQLLNVLVLPWPLRIDRSRFRMADPHRDGCPTAAGPFGHFAYEPAPVEDIAERVSHALDVAERHAVDIDLVVMPELALGPSELQAAVEVCRKRSCMLVCGVHVPSDFDRTELLPAGPANVAVFDHAGITKAAANTLSTQRKHHRWCLDSRQIRLYGLEGWLPTTGNLWESAEVGQREIRFHTIHNWLTMATLICEDLARQDPVSEVLRAVGPNLVIALLMDGPQIAGRWPERYATVLADDPGSSVLTVNSLGMSLLGHEHAQKQGWPDNSRAIAMWKDVEAREVIRLGPEHDAAILHVVNKRRTEYTADGRGDGGVASFPTLAGWTLLTIGDPSPKEAPTTE